MAIRDQGYSRYEGDLTGGSPAWWVVAQNGFSLHWQFLRSKLLFFALMLVPVLFILGTFGERAATKFLGGGGGGAEEITGFYEYSFGYVQVWMLAIYFAAAGCGVIAEDLRFKTIQLYFSKPIKRTDYIIGKFVSLLLFGGLVTLVPTILVATVRILVFVPTDLLGEAATKVGGLLIFSVVLLCFQSLLVMALSCLTPKTGYVVLAWAGTMLIPSVIATIVDLVRKGEDWPELLSIAGTLGVSLQTLISYDGLPQGQAAPEPLADYMMYSPWLILVALAAGAVGVLYWRTNKLEGIA